MEQKCATEGYFGVGHEITQCTGWLERVGEFAI